MGSMRRLYERAFYIAPCSCCSRSPLNNAFLIGNVDVIRLLLNARADLDYRNGRPWTAVSFLWDLDRPAHPCTGEILDICVSQGFDAWNDTDTEGWSLCHRAAAYGRGEDIRNLACKGGNMHTYTTTYLWGPVTCAVWDSNESTFDAFVDLLPTEEIITFKDSRGWMLLHFAAKEGCKYIMKKLLDLGVDHEAETFPTDRYVSEALEWKCLTAKVIAYEYGHGQMWEEIIGSGI